MIRAGGEETQSLDNGTLGGPNEFDGRTLIEFFDKS